MVGLTGYEHVFTIADGDFMSQLSTIEWTDTTWNPSTGCSRVSAGCRFCYAETLAARLKRMGSARYENGFEFTMHWDKIKEPLSWKKPRKVFVNSMSDLFHENSRLDFVREVFKVMQAATQHQFQVLTKRPDRMRDWLRVLQDEGAYSPSNHIWLGTSVENARVRKRIDELREVPAKIRFLSCEPLLGPLKELDLAGISWVIVGGESGTHLWNDKFQARRALVKWEQGKWNVRPDRAEWVREIRDECLATETPFFFKQWGGATPKAGGRMLDGELWEQYPHFPIMPRIGHGE